MVFNLENYVVNPYIRALIILVVSFVVLRFVVFVLQRFVLRLTKKTKTDVDDRFIEKASKPITVLVLLIGFRLALEELPAAQRAIEVAGNVIYSFIVIYMAVVLYHFVDIILFVALKKVLKGESDKGRESLMSLLHSIIKVLMIAIAILYILDVWGIQIGPFLAAMGIAGIAVALALQPAMGNVFAGMSMILDESVKVGDLIYLDAETRGKVSHIGLRSTKIITFDNELIIVPNSKVADSRIQNIGEPDPKARVVVPFGVSYGTDVDKVKKIVLEEIKKIEHYIENPEPIVRFLEMANSSLNFKAYFYVESFEFRWKAIDEANTRIYKLLNKSGIGIPFPQMDIHIKDGKK
jgi:MscS family membrane protein